MTDAERALLSMLAETVAALLRDKDLHNTADALQKAARAVNKDVYIKAISDSIQD